MKTRALKVTTIEIRCGHRKLSVSADSAALGSARVHQVPQPRLANSVDDTRIGIRSRGANNNGHGTIKEESNRETRNPC